jgi:hypothetical protein
MNQKIAVLAPLILIGWSLSAAWSATREDVDFNRDIRPLLTDRCFLCHGPDETDREADLRLDLRAVAVSELDSGDTAIVPGNAAASILIERITEADEDLRMPPADSRKKPLTPAQIELFRRWIDQGAKYARHWSFTPIDRAALPAVQDQDDAELPIDRLVLAELEDRGLQPAPEADRRTLIRRLSFDLIGLPPSMDEVADFVGDQRPDAYRRLVDRLLASPHYGERMAIFWLDLVRYADSVGFHGDQELTYWPYRDYVINALNENMPFDQFTREQLAGDLLPNATRQQKIAATYNRLGMMTAEGGAQPKEYLAIYNADRIRNVAGTWLGVTIGCAQCHDHKFDPITTRDFYSLGAFFADIKEEGFYGKGYQQGMWGEMLILSTPEQEDQLESLTDQIATLEKQLVGAPAKPAADEDEALTKRRGNLAHLKKEKANLEKALTKMPASVAGEPRVMRVLPRGNWMDDSGPVVAPAVPAFLGPLETGDRRATRRDLADWLVAPTNPLTARVLANRVWRLFFGQGICRSVDDLGAQGQWPSHPKLLDWLAAELIDNRWDMKHLVRTIVLSQTYRQSSQPRPELAKVDPDNRLLARQTPLRLDSELVRDNALALSGLLVTTVGGPSAKPYQPEGYYAQLNFPTRTYHADSGPQQYRRGLYTHWQRTFLHPMLRAFDAPSREDCTAMRVRSNTPLQALTLLNDPSLVEAARVLAERIIRAGGATNADRIEWAYRLVLAQHPASDVAAVLATIHQKHLDHYRTERDAAAKLTQVGQWQKATDLDVAELAAWTSTARVLLNLHETITRY